MPVITVLGLDVGNYLTGSILTETIFSWPGVGRYVLQAIEKRDLPAVQGSILFLSVVFVLAGTEKRSFSIEEHAPRLSWT